MVIYLGGASPRPSSDLPEGANEAGHLSPPIWSCSRRGLPSRRSRLRRWWALTSPFHPYPRNEFRRRSILCGTVPGIAPAGGYPAPYPLEFGLSSAPLEEPRPSGNLVPREPGGSGPII